MTTVILPCAGEGKRLGLNFPKELYEIFSGIRLIDFSLMHIKKYIDLQQPDDLRVDVVIRDSKLDVFDYVKKYLSGIEVVKVYFNDDHFEWAGSVFSAEKIFGEKKYSSASRLFSHC